MNEALIAGGGIAGMAAALALAREGWRVTVCEESPAPAEVGAGLQMSPNAARVLRWLGVLDAVAARAFRPRAAEMRDGRSGTRIYRVALNAAAGRGKRGLISVAARGSRAMCCAPKGRP
jgi:salicylate hydroxylase